MQDSDLFDSIHIDFLRHSSIFGGVRSVWHAYIVR